MRLPTERRWAPWLNSVRRTTSHSTSTRPRSWWWITGDRAENTHPSPSTRHLWSGWPALSSHHRGSHMVCLHRCSAEEGTSASLLPETAEEVWNEPQHPQVLLHLHCGEHPDRLYHRLVWKQHRKQNRSYRRPIQSSVMKLYMAHQKPFTFPSSTCRSDTGLFRYIFVGKIQSFQQC